MRKYPVALLLLVIGLIVACLMGCMSMRRTVETEKTVTDTDEDFNVYNSGMAFYSADDVMELVESRRDANFVFQSDSNVRRQKVYAADPSVRFGVTPLMISTDETMTRRLIELGADVNWRTSRACNGVSDMTPLMYAKDVEAVKALIEAGADVHAKTNMSQTVIMYIDDPASLWLLVEAGVDVNAKDQYGRTALMYLASHPTCDYCDVYFDGARSAESMKALLDLGANIDETDFRGANALMYAAKQLDLANIELLIKAGIDVNAVDYEGNNVLSYIGEETENYEASASIDEVKRVLQRALSNK